MATASTPTLDTTTAGNWIGNYGTLGQKFIGSTTVGTWPSGWGLSTDGIIYNKGYLEAESEGESNYLENIHPATERCVGCWYNNGTLNFTITPPDSATYQLALYDCYQEGGAHRQYSIDILDNATSTVLQTLPTTYYYFKYVVFEFTGTIKIVLTASQPVTTGFFLDNGSAPPMPANRLCGFGQSGLIF